MPADAGGLEGHREMSPWRLLEPPQAERTGFGDRQIWIQFPALALARCSASLPSPSLRFELEHRILLRILSGAAWTILVRCQAHTVPSASERSLPMCPWQHSGGSA